MDFNNDDDGFKQYNEANGTNSDNQNDYNNQDFNYNGGQYTPTTQNAMATAALIMGILAIVSVCCVYGSWIFGSIGITLGLLSRGGEKNTSANAKAGIITSTVGIILSIVMLIYSVFSFIQTFGNGSLDTFMEEYKKMIEEEMDLNDSDINSLFKGTPYENYFDDGTL